MASAVSRRGFMQGSAVVGAATLLSAKRAQGANERIRAGFIVVANRGGQLIKAALPHEDMEIVAVCDVHKPTMEKWAGELEGDVAQYGDFRRMLERDDIDAIFIATPDHWHAIQCIMACESGKDVYVEKPLSMTIGEGQRMVKAARARKRVVQVGLHRRSSDMYEELHQTIKRGDIGKVSVGHAYRITNMWPNGIGKCEDTAPPADLDWDMWLGPRAYRPYRENITPYKFRWWSDYSSQVGNWGVHYFDLFRWMVDEGMPCSVSAHGGRFVIDDDRTIPDTLEATFEFSSGRLFSFGQYEASGTPMLKSEIDLRGTKGIINATGRGYEINPEKGGQFQDPAPRMEARSGRAAGSNANLTSDHIRDFLDCIKTRNRPKADVEIGHHSTVFAHLANISLAVKSRLEWDAATETITNTPEAQEMMDYEYRAPWGKA